MANAEAIVVGFKEHSFFEFVSVGFVRTCAGLKLRHESLLFEVIKGFGQNVHVGTIHSSLRCSFVGAHFGLLDLRDSFGHPLHKNEFCALALCATTLVNAPTAECAPSKLIALQLLLEFLHTSLT